MFKFDKTVWAFQRLSRLSIHESLRIVATPAWALRQQQKLFLGLTFTMGSAIIFS